MFSVAETMNHILKITHIVSLLQTTFRAKFHLCFQLKYSQKSKRCNQNANTVCDYVLHWIERWNAKLLRTVINTFRNTLCWYGQLGISRPKIVKESSWEVRRGVSAKLGGENLAPQIRQPRGGISENTRYYSQLPVYVHFLVNLSVKTTWYQMIG